QIWLPMVPEGTNRPAGWPSIAAASSSRRRTVGSSPKTSSPTSARAIASRIAGVGLVNVSLRKSAIREREGGVGMAILAAGAAHLRRARVPRSPQSADRGSVPRSRDVTRAGSSAREHDRDAAPPQHAAQQQLAVAEQELGRVVALTAPVHEVEVAEHAEHHE